MSNFTGIEPVMEYEIKPKNSFSLGFKELWQYRELFWHFAWRDISVKYRHAALGILWAILQPLFLMLIFTLVFNKGFGIASSHLPYPVFMFSGLIIWQFFATGITNASNSMVRNSTIIHKIYFPRLVIPLSSIFTCFLDFCFAFLVMIILIFIQGIPIEPAYFALYSVLGLSLAFLASSGVGIMLAALNTKYRDFQYLTPFLVQLMFFVSPVLYETERFRGGLFHNVLKFNPIAGALNFQRAAISGIPPDWTLVGTSSASLIILFLMGIYIFRKMESYFADLA